MMITWLHVLELIERELIELIDKIAGVATAFNGRPKY